MQWMRVLACVFAAVPIGAQMPMNMPMPGNPAPAQTRAAQGKPAERTQPSAPQGSGTAHPAMPFGALADGDTSRDPRAIPVTPSPVTLGATVQEQEHPDRRTGTADGAMPDVLADVRGRTPEPLPFFLARAEANNPTLRQAEAEVRRLRAEARQAGLWQNPEIGYEADHVRGGSYGGGEQGGYVQQAIPLGGQRSAARLAVAAEVSVAEAVLATQRKRVESAVAGAFYAALALQREAEVRGEMAALAADATVATHQMANVGQADAPDVLESEVEREQAKLDLQSAQRAYRKAFVALAGVSGDAALPVAPLAGDLLAVPVLGADAAEHAAEESPALEAARQEATAREAAVRGAQRAAWPELVLKAGLQHDNEPLEAPGQHVGVVGIAQAGLSVPVWNRNQGTVEAQRAQQAGAHAEVLRTQLNLRMQAEQAMQDYANAMGQVQQYREELLPRARRAAELYQQKYAAMAAAYPQRMLSQKMLLQLELDYARALGTAWHNAVLLQHGLLTDGLAAPESVPGQRGAAE